MPAKDASAQSVERADPHPPGLLAQEPGDPVAHLAGGLVGEGNREDAVGRNSLMVDQVRNASGEDPSLPRSGPRQDEQRAFEVYDGLTLGFVEPDKVGVGCEGAAPSRLRGVQGPNSLRRQLREGGSRRWLLRPPCPRGRCDRCGRIR